MVDVPVHDDNFFAELCSLFRCHSDVIEEAETLDKVRVGMMTWWTNYAVSMIVTVIEDGAHSREATLTRELSRCKGF